ncbi:thiamine-phosphate synthase [Oxobacter pfennigii]|uniref:Thiamine-phosphate synthase n=1 Tax=Oxobacter pfennigii TaxID=36849 RepID=A0A0P8WCC5_9CLOT|nr:thiamine phosphate synthase [Oxobacter pfennigii]KPU45543.1 thiamine-phosphate synthase [Oxobacter pfennigii]
MSSLKEIYLITDEGIEFNLLYDKCRIALDNGIKLLQYRRKEGSFKEKIYEVNKLLELCTKSGCKLIINDRVDIALASGAHGVHLGREDMDVKTARKILRDKIIGATAKTVEQAVTAFEEGADYLGVGALFPSVTKKDAIGITINILKAIRKAVPIPIYGIGGITSHNLTPEIIENVNGVSVVSAILRSDDTLSSIEKLREVLSC